MKGSLRDFRALVALDEERHFGRAALKVAMTQPQLSELIARMETSLGLSLFTRRPQVVPTPSGTALVETARNVLAEVQRGIERAQHLETGGAGVVRIGFVTTVMLTPLAASFSGFLSARPEVQLRFREGYSRELLEALDNDLVDVVFVRVGSAAGGMHSLPVLAEPFIAAFDEKGHEDQPPKDVTSFVSQPLVLFPRERAPAFYDQIIRVAADAGFAPSAVHHVEGWQSTLALVRNGFGMTIAPACLRKLHWEGLSYRDLPAEHPKAQIFMIWKAEAPPAAQAFARTVRATAAQLS
jgi:DNA-binding transcriptional LysR family regulator